MKRTRFIFLILCSGLSFAARSQSSIADVLRQIEANNKELQANSQQAAARKLEARAENNLPDPSVSYTHQYGNRAGMGMEGELVVSQSFDFPALYVQRGRLSKAKAQSLDRQQAELRREILLAAREICLDLILLNRQEEWLQSRLDNAVQLAELYARRLANGDANLLETNKIDLELLNVKTGFRRNAAAITQKQQELKALNGGVDIRFTATTGEPQEELPPFDVLRDEAFAGDPQLLALKSEQAVNRQALTVSRSQWLPGLTLGYQLNTAVNGQRFNGFLAGMSIPLFSNRHRVRQAQAELLYSGLKYDNASARVESELFQLYRQSAALKESMKEYEQLLKNQNNLALLQKALDAGQISIIEYFVEITSYYDSLSNYRQLENEYGKAIGRLLKHRL